MTEREKIAQIISEHLCPQGKAHKTLYGAARMCYSYNNFADCEKVSGCVDALIADGIGNVSEWKRRAEIAENKLLELAMFCTKGNPYLSKEHSQEKEAYKLFNDWLQQAAREIEGEERK